MLNHPDRTLENLWSQGLGDRQQKQDEYDAETDHGRTEGAVLNTSIGLPETG
ncbi:MAG: hypothetical protein IBX68_12700 [Dehalococcoidia bacterium]|nr:hypothetical protein [Dehalococcoidia bacterium]